MIELKLEKSGWWVRCRYVPTLATGIYNDPALQYPPPPRVEVKTIAGTEEMAAPDDSPERREYFEACRLIDQLREQADKEFEYSYGVMEWSRDKKSWSKTPPKGWKLDPVLKRHLGYEPDRRTAFIMYELCAARGDMALVSGAIYDVDMTPLLSGEIQAAEDSFPD